MTDHRDLKHGDRVRAVHFPLDTGLRIWPMQDHPEHHARVVRVDEPDTFTEVFRGPQLECQENHPDATWSINDNESVPPGTLGTVDYVGPASSLSSNVAIEWDNGRRLHLAFHDVVERVE